MKYQLSGSGWPIADRLIPPGTILDYSQPLNDYTRLAQGKTPPWDAAALDAEAYSAMLAAYPGTTIQYSGTGSLAPLCSIGPWWIKKGF